MKRTYLLLALVVLTTFSCRKDSDDWSEDAPQILSFEFTDTLNKDLVSGTVKAEISENSIVLTIPDVIDASNLIATFDFVGEGVYVNEERQESGVAVNDFSQPVQYEVRTVQGLSKTYAVKVNLIAQPLTKVAHIIINTDDYQPVDSKEEYVLANILVDGKGIFEDYHGRTKIRGRGHDSWDMPKKPYKIKLDDKESLLGLLPGKKWILLANYRAESLMSSAVAFKMASLLDMPYTHHAVPVDVTLNGEFLGSYTFTEQKEVKKNRINVGEGGLYLNLDSYMHKPPGLFYSDYFELPVMIRYPDFDDFGPDEIEENIKLVSDQFHLFEQLVYDDSFPNNNYLDYFDADEFVNYMIVYNLSLNREINHPKSTFMHKHKDGKFKMGPVWDFDWSFGYNQMSNEHFDLIDLPFISDDPNLPGSNFFGKLMTDPELQTLYKQRWNQFRIEKLPLLYEYINEYAEWIKESYDLDYEKWEQGVGSSQEAAAQMIDWLQKRASYVDAYVAEF